MKTRQYVAYYRVSTQKQGHSGLGLEAQAESVRAFVERAQGKLVAEFFEVKRGSKSARPQLAEALRICRMRRAVLVIARLDRLSRNLALISSLMDSDLDFVAADFPHASRLTLHVLAAIAEYESKLTSVRVKAALAAAKARGVKIGGYRINFDDLGPAVAASVAARQAKVKARAMDLAPIVWDMKANGKTLTEIAEALTRQRIAAPMKGAWDKQGVVRILQRTASAFPTLAEAAAVGLRPRVAQAQQRAEGLAPLVWSLRRNGLSLTGIAEEMNRRKVWTPRGGQWHTSAVLRILRRTAPAYAPPEDAISITCVGRRSMHAKQRARDLGPLLWELRTAGCSCGGIAAEFTRRKIRAPQGGRWHPSVVRTLLLQTAALHAPVNEGTADGRLGLDPGRAKKRAMKWAPLVWLLKAQGRSIAAIADELNRRGVASSRGRRWHHDAVKQVLDLTESDFAPLAERAARLPSPHAMLARQRAAALAAPVWNLRRGGMTLAAIADALTRQGLPTPGGKHKWFATTVRNVLLLTVDDFTACAEAWAALPSLRTIRATERARKVAPIAWKLKGDGQSYAAIAGELDRRDISPPRGHRWRASSIARVLRITAEELQAPRRGGGTGPPRLAWRDTT